MLSPHLNKIFEVLKENKEGAATEGPFISVNKLTGRAGALYEKMRYLVDYKEEHTIRRSAIERIVKRKLLVKISDKGVSPDFGLSLIQELIGGGYLPNKEIPESYAGNVQKIIYKYLIFNETFSGSQNIIISLMASEIQGFLYPQTINNLIVDFFYATVAGSVKYSGTVSQSDLDMQTYIGCRRSLLEDDQETLLYAVLLKYFPELPALVNEDEVRNMAPKFLQSLSAAEQSIEHPLGWKTALKLKNHSVCFAVIREILRRNGAASESIFADDKLLEQEVRKILDEKYAQQRKIVNRSGFRAVAYVFLTKIIVALILELPYEKFFLQSIDYYALGTNIVLHPLLLLMMVRTTRGPTSSNTNFIFHSIKIMARSESIKPIYIKEQTHSIILYIAYAIIYTILFALSFGLIASGLKYFHFNIVSITLFIFFLTLVSYFGFRIRYNAKKWIISMEDEGTMSLLWSLFTTPIIRTGRWLSTKFSSINVFVLFMDFIIETPFKFILGTFDSFISFLKEERGEHY